MLEAPGAGTTLSLVKNWNIPLPVFPLIE